MQVADLLSMTHKGCYILLKSSSMRNAVKTYVLFFISIFLNSLLFFIKKQEVQLA